MRVLLVILFGFLATGKASLGADWQNRHAEAVAVYDSGNFSKAVEIYEGIVRSGVKNGYVFYNLGNAYYRAGRIGAAMANYLKAREWLPADPDVLANIKFIKLQLKDKLEGNFSRGALWPMVAWSEFFTIAEILLLSFMAVALALLLFFIRSIKDAFDVLMPIGWSFVFIAVVGFVLGISRVQGFAYASAIVSKQASVRSGPGAVNAELFSLHEGAPIIIEDTDSDWFKITIETGERGWVPKSAVYTL